MGVILEDGEAGVGNDVISSEIEQYKIEGGEKELFSQLERPGPQIASLHGSLRDRTKDKDQEKIGKMGSGNTKTRKGGSKGDGNTVPVIVVNQPPTSMLQNNLIVSSSQKVTTKSAESGNQGLERGSAMVEIHSLGNGITNKAFTHDDDDVCCEGQGNWTLVGSAGLIRTRNGHNPELLCPGPKDEYADVIKQGVENRYRRKSEGDMKNQSMRHAFVLENHRRRCLQFIRHLIVTRVDGRKIKERDFVDAMANVELLGKLFCLFDFNHQTKLKQDEWIEFLKSRLNGEEKQIDFVEVVESVTYALYRDADINFERFCAIFRTKNVLNKLFRLIDRNLDGVISADQVMEFISQLSSTGRPNSRLTEENIKWLEKVFRQNVGEGNEIRKEDFKKIIQTKNQFFTERMFEIFDVDSSGSISLQEFLHQMHMFMGDDPDYKIKFLFQCYDVDGDGLIQEHELEDVMIACMDENGMKFSADQIRELTKALFEDADVEGRGTLTYEALKAQLEKHGGLLENLSISIERWLVPAKPKEEKTSIIDAIRARKPHQLSTKYFRNNYVYLVWLAAFLCTNVGLFLYRIFTWKDGDDHANDTDYVVVARAAGQCLNFNCTFVVVMMLRQSLTFLRARGASSFLPIDQHIYFHKLTGWAIFFFSILHTITHLINISVGVLKDPLHKNDTYMQVLFDPKKTTDTGLVHGYAFNSGVLIMIILTIMVICALPFVRRRGSFEVFYWTHLLYVAFLAILIIHAPNFWKWFVVIGVMLLVEQAFRIYQWRGGHGKTTIRAGILLPSKVTHLTIKRPPNFEFQAGDYVFVRIPEIAKFEWHPFTISSAPEQREHISLHIRGVGEWTNRLFEYFEKQQAQFVDLGDHTEIDVLLPGQSGFQATKLPLDGHLETPTMILEEETHFSPALSKQIQGRRPLKSIGDSFTTVGPPSSASVSGSLDRSSNFDTSSEMLNNGGSECVLENTKHRKLMKHPKLSSAASLPDVSEGNETEGSMVARMMKPLPVQRSYSVQAPQEDDVDYSNNKIKSYTRLRSGSSHPFSDSIKHLRNKPKIITFSDGTCEDKLAEEGNGPLAANGGVNKLVATSKWSSFQVTSSTDDDVNGHKSSLEIYVDGPFGAPSSHIFRAQHAVLIATGIGVTPFASILQSIMLRYTATRQSCPRCQHSWCADISEMGFNLKKVDFLWINREQRSFEWFVHLLSQLEIHQAEIGGAMERFLDMHMYITSALQRTDMKAVGLQLALDLLHKKDKRDLITGLKTRTNAGRPNWDKLFKQLQDQNKGKITVFYCGPPQLARTLKLKCDDFGFTFRKELF